MEKYFNVTGSCNPQKHYMVDVTDKFNQVMKMIKRGDYFAINRPRQYGKTTMLSLIAKAIREQKDKYILSRMSFEGVDDNNFKDTKIFCPEFARRFAKSLKLFYPDSSKLAETLSATVKCMDSLSTFISEFCIASNHQIIVLVDEVDKSSNNQLFLSFLGMLRDKYIATNDGEDTTFHSVILAGVHDVKSLKLHLRDDCEAKLNSPWNIAADFNVDMSFNSAEIATMLTSYAEEEDVKMSIDSLAERIYYYTNGYPFLVSKICKNIAEEEAGQNSDYNPKHWTLDDIDWSFRWLTRESYSTTNFDDLVKNLENNPDLYNLVNAILFNGTDKSISYSVKNPVVNQGILYGMFKDGNGRTVIHNRVYEQILCDYMRSKQETATPNQGFNGYALGYIDKDGVIDIGKTILKFQEFMKEHYSSNDNNFLEREGRLLFMSFLKPIINGKGFMWKEPVVDDERRMDLIVTYGNIQKAVIELKIWRGDKYHQAGLQQLSDYLDFQDLKNGYLLIFDFRKNKTYKSETITFQDKSIFTVWI